MWRAAVAALVAIAASAGPARGQDAPGTPQTTDPAVQNDTNPTDAVLFSLRPEIYVPNDDLTLASLILRYDRIVFREGWLTSRRGVINRFELPITGAWPSGAATTSGLGDAYAQMIVAPYFTRGFAWVAGTGLGIPTATDELLGTGKWMFAPLTGPVWFFQRRGLAFVRVQGLVSFAGDPDRRDIRALVIAPTFVHAITRRMWFQVDSEFKKNWARDGRTSKKSGLQLGRVVASKFGVWAKPEIWWGDNQEGQWNLKFGLVWYR